MVLLSIRELNKVYTNGTLVDAELLTDEQAGHCVCICESTVESADDATSESMSDAERKFGFCILDCSTSEFNLSSFEDDICRTKLETLMRQICPKELVFKKVRAMVFPSFWNDILSSSIGVFVHQYSALVEERYTLQLPLDILACCRGA